MKPLSVKLVRLSAQDIHSHSSRSVPADEDSSSGDGDESCELFDEVAKEYTSVGCGGGGSSTRASSETPASANGPVDVVVHRRSKMGRKLETGLYAAGTSEAAASVIESVDAVVQHRSKMSQKLNAGSEDVEELRGGGLTGKGKESVPFPVSSTQSKPSITRTVLPRSQYKKQGRRDGPYAKNIGVMEGVVGGGEKQSGVSSKSGASEAATSASVPVDRVIRRTSKGRKQKASFFAALDLQGSRGDVTGSSIETLPSAVSSTEASTIPAVSEYVLSPSQCRIQECQGRSNAKNSNGCCGEKQSDRSTKRGADEATASATGSADAVVQRTSKKSRKQKARQNLHSAEQSCRLEASVKETVLPPCQNGNAPDTTDSLYQTSTDHDHMTSSVFCNSQLNGARKKGDDVKLAEKEPVPTEDQSATLASVRCSMTASSTTVTESHQFSTGTSVSTLRLDHGKVRGRRGRPYGSRRARGVDRSFGDLSHRTVPDGTTGSDGINDVASSGTTNDRGAVRGRRGRSYGSRRARGTRQSFTNPPHLSVPYGTGCDSGVDDMTHGAYTGYLPQYSAAVAHDVSWMQQGLPVSATGYPGETKHTVIVICQSDL